MAVNLSRLAAAIEPAIGVMGFELVRVRLTGGQRAVLQVMIERADRAAITVEDCADASHAISAILDVEDPISGAYRLEVSSPGIDRPLTRAGDFERFAGWEARLETRVPVDGRKRFRGVLKGLDADGRVVMATDAGELSFEVADVDNAKLVLTDELIAATLAEQRQATATENGAD